VHDGTSQPALDISHDLVSAIGGQEVHCVEFAGAGILPVRSGSSMMLEEPNQSGPGYLQLCELVVAPVGDRLPAGGDAPTKWDQHRCRGGVAGDGQRHGQRLIR
jgi:hypothetical protein